MSSQRPSVAPEERYASAAARVAESEQRHIVAAARVTEAERRRADLAELAMAAAAVTTGAWLPSRSKLASFWKSLTAWLNREVLMARPAADTTAPLPEPRALPSSFVGLDRFAKQELPPPTHHVVCLVAPNGPGRALATPANYPRLGVVAA